jgi:transcriptional regulator with XRE-family HTH domain
MGEERGTIVAERLRSYRQSRRLTGEEVGKRLGITKGTVSKLEHGALPVTIDYLARFCHELRLSTEQTSELMELACVFPAGAKPGEFLQLLPFDFVSLDWSERSQRTVARWEEQASKICVYQPLLLPGLLQPETYATDVLRSAGVSGETAIQKAVASRMRRQHILKVRGKSFCFLIAEAALYHYAATRSVDEALRHLLKLTIRDNIRIGIIPFGSPIQSSPPPPFYLFDDSNVYLELPHGDLFLMQPSIATIYVTLFDSLTKSALFGNPAAKKLDDLLRQRSVSTA